MEYIAGIWEAPRAVRLGKAGMAMALPPSTSETGWNIQQSRQLSIKNKQTKKNHLTMVCLGGIVG